MKYLSIKAILVIHSEIIDQTGGLHGVRDIGLLESVSEKPKSGFGGKEIYSGIFKKAAVYTESLINYHVFFDGNKRTGIVIAGRLLFLNGYELNASNKDLENFAIDIALKKLDLAEITKWFKTHSKKIKR